MYRLKLVGCRQFDVFWTLPVCSQSAVWHCGTLRPKVGVHATTPRNKVHGRMWWSLEWDRRPTTTRPGSGAGLAVVAQADWLQGHTQ